MKAEIKALREKRAKLIHDAQAMCAPGQTFNAEVDAKVNAMLSEAADLQREINAKQAIMDAAADLDRPVLASRAGRENVLEATGAEGMQIYAQAFEKYLREGPTALDADERAALRTGFTAVETGQSTTTNNKGGYMVPKTMATEVEVAMSQLNALRRAGAEVIQTGTGSALDYPTVNDTGVKGRRVAENAGGSLKDAVFGTAPLNVFTYTSDLFGVSNELLADAVTDVGALVGRLAGERIARITNEEETIGDGDAKPNGVVTASTLGKTTVGSATAFNTDELTDLVFSVPEAYRANGKFMMHDTSIAACAKLKDDEGRPLLIAGYRDGEADRFLNRPIFANNDMDELTDAQGKVVLFGDFTKYKIRVVPGWTVRRLEERYAELNQTGFIAFAREGGNLIDAGTHPVKHLKLKAA